ncbi:MAG: carboxypeptidase-like regulatory domain-containing protein [Acidobacteriota bacterium]
MEVEGLLTRKGEPAAGTLAFSDSTFARQFSMEAGPDGRFAGMLPEEGRWLVEVVSDTGRTRVGGVDVRLEAGEARAQVDVEIGGNVLTGIVVDREGKEVAGARVIVGRSTGPPISLATSGASGSFEIRGLQDGEYVVTAISAQGSSAPTVTAVHDDPGTPLRLVIAPSSRLRGIVRGPWGAIAGAAIVGVPRCQGDSGARKIIRTGTALDGSFEVEVATGCTAADIAIIPPGLGAKLLVLATTSEPTVIEIGPTSGVLKVVGETNWRQLVNAAAALPARLVLQTAAGAGWLAEGDGQSIPVEPGRYGLCSAFGTAGRCTWVVVEHNTEQVLDAVANAGGSTGVP